MDAIGGWRNRIAAAALLAVLLTLPAANAASASGDLHLRGSLRVPLGIDGEFTALAMLDTETGAWDHFELTAPSASVCVYEQQYAEATAGGTTFRTVLPGGERSFCDNLTRVRVSLAYEGRHDGWAGFQAAPGGILTTTAAETIDPHDRSTLASGDADVSGNDLRDTAGQPYFRRHIDGPHLRFHAAGAAVYQGAGCAKFKGPDLQVQAEEAATTVYATQHRNDTQESVAEGTARWLWLCFSSGSVFTILHPGRLESAVEHADRANWSGNVTFLPIAGALTTPDGVYEPDGAPKWLVGDFTARIAPTSDAAGLAISVDGELQATSLRHVPTRVTDGPLSTVAPWFVVGAVVATGAAVAVGGAIVKARKHVLIPTSTQASPASPPPLLGDRRGSLEKAGEIIKEAMRTAENAQSPTDWRRAAKLYRKARTVDPGIAELAALDEGFCWLKANEYAKAIEAYEEAAITCMTGEAERWAAEAAIDFGDDELALTYLLRAMDRDPAGFVVSEIANEPTFAPLRQRRELREAIQEWARSHDVDPRTL